jgi:hypothetical protein
MWVIRAYSDENEVRKDKLSKILDNNSSYEKKYVESSYNNKITHDFRKAYVYEIKDNALKTIECMEEINIGFSTIFKAEKLSKEEFNHYLDLKKENFDLKYKKQIERIESERKKYT